VQQCAISCKPVGMACTGQSDCCGGASYCGTSGTCVTCFATGQVCTASYQCCVGGCSSGVCKTGG
jgi:hypothetical protein